MDGQVKSDCGCNCLIKWGEIEPYAKKILRLNEEEDTWIGGVVNEIRSFLSGLYNVLVVREYGYNGLRILVKVLKNSGYKPVLINPDLSLGNRRIAELLLNNFRVMPDNEIPVLVGDHRYVFVHTRTEFLNKMRGRAKKASDEDALERNVSRVPLRFPERKIVIVEPKSIEGDVVYKTVSFVEWRPYNLFRVLSERIGDEDLARRIVKHVGGNYEYLRNTVKARTNLVERVFKYRKYDYGLLFDIENGDLRKGKYYMKRLGRDVSITMILNAYSYMSFGNKVMLPEPRVCGLSYYHGSNIVGYGIDIDCFHEKTRFAYRFVVGRDCSKCEFRDVCPFKYFHPARCMK